MPDVLLLELDGVLLDSLDAKRHAVRDALAGEGFPLSDAELDELLLTHPLAAATAAAAERAGLAPDPTAADLLALRAERALELRLAGGATLAPGAAAFVERARARARVALVTSASRRRADAALALAGLGDAFECVVTAEDALHAKPHPESYTHALARLGRRRSLTPTRCVALEGTRDGLRAARAAGLHTLAIGPFPPHLAVEADGWLPTLDGATTEMVDAAARTDAPVR